MKRVLVVAGDAPKALMKLDVLDADMPHPGWMRFRLESSIPTWESPTTVWYRVPDGADTVELQHEIEDADVAKRAARLRGLPLVRLGRLSLYLEPRDMWVGCYVARDAVYVCPVPCVVVRWQR